MLRETDTLDPFRKSAKLIKYALAFKKKERMDNLLENKIGSDDYLNDKKVSQVCILLVPILDNQKP